MALTIGIKKLTIDNIPYSIKTGSTEYMPSTSEKTPIVDDISGLIIGATQERKAGMVKVQVALLNASDNNVLRDLDGSEIVMELVSGLTVTGKNMIQIAANSASISDGTTEFEFAGDVREK